MSLSVALHTGIADLEEMTIDELYDMAKTYNAYMEEVRAESGQKQ